MIASLKQHPSGATSLEFGSNDLNLEAQTSAYEIISWKQANIVQSTRAQPPRPEVKHLATAPSHKNSNSKRQHARDAGSSRRGSPGNRRRSRATEMPNTVRCGAAWTGRSATVRTSWPLCQDHRLDMWFEQPSHRRSMYTVRSITQRGAQPTWTGACGCSSAHFLILTGQPFASPAHETGPTRFSHLASSPYMRDRSFRRGEGEGRWVRYSIRLSCLCASLERTERHSTDRSSSDETASLLLLLPAVPPRAPWEVILAVSTTRPRATPGLPALGMQKQSRRIILCETSPSSPAVQAGVNEMDLGGDATVLCCAVLYCAALRCAGRVSMRAGPIMMYIVHVHSTYMPPSKYYGRRALPPLTSPPWRLCCPLTYWVVSRGLCDWATF